LQMGKAHAEFLASAHQAAEEWKRALRAVFERVELLVLPTLGVVPPEITAGGDDTVLAAATLPGNTAGVPALAMPVPTPGARVPASLQLIGPWDAEERLLAAAAVVEAAVGPWALRVTSALRLPVDSVTVVEPGAELGQVVG